MSVRERIKGFLRQRTIDEMCKLAADEIDRGGSLNIEIGHRTERKFLNISSENLHESLPTFLEMLKSFRGGGHNLRLTILNRDHQRTGSFSGMIELTK